MPALTPLYIDTPVGQPDLPVYARDLRAQADGLQAGVVGATHLKAAASGLGLTVQPGTVYVPDGQPVPTLYRCEWSGSAASVALTTANGSNPRIDQLIARVRDMNVDGGTQRDWLLEVLPGAPAGGATLDNRIGAASLPARSVRLADVLVPAGASSITAGNVRDRRPWARGASAVGVASAAVSTSTTTSIPGESFRLELSGAPIIIESSGSYTGAGTDAEARIFVYQDGVLVFATGVAQLPRATVPYSLTEAQVNPAPEPGSRLFSTVLASALGTVGISTGTLRVRELVGGLQSNGTA